MSRSSTTWTKSEAAQASARAAMRIRMPESVDPEAGPGDRLLPVQAAAERLGCSATYIYRRAHTLPFMRQQGHAWRVSQQALDEYARSHPAPGPRLVEKQALGPGHPRIGRPAAAGIAPLDPNAPKSRRKARRSVDSPGGSDRSTTPLSTLKARVRIRGLQAIDQRTLPARFLLDWRRDLLADLGGESHATAAQIALVEIATRTRLFLDHVDAILLALPALINRRRKLLPLVEQRQRLADSLVRTLSTLGLERRVPKPVSLSDYLATPREGSPATEETDPT